MNQTIGKIWKMDLCMRIKVWWTNTPGLGPADLQCNCTSRKHTTQDRNHNTSIQRRWEGPLNTNSYCGVTLTSMLAKVLEALTLTRLQCHFLDRNIPHPNQTAYRKGVSCAEAIFSIMELSDIHILPVL